MHIASYVHMRRMIRPTGVGKHIIHMVSGLARRPNMDVTILADRRDLDASGKVPADSPLAGLPAHPLGMRRGVLEKSWAFLKWPRVDSGGFSPDWVYCPAEVYVPARRARVAVTVHDVHFFETDLPWSNTPEHLRARHRWGPLMRRVVGDADLILAVSHFTKLRLIELLGANSRKIEIVGNGVELDASHDDSQPTKDQEKWSAQGPYLAIVGGLSPRKGMEYVFQFADRLAQAMPKMRILVAGSPQGAPSVTSRPNIQELDYVSEEQLRGFLRGATALLFLSRYEGFGVPAIEAMAAGTPVIASSFAALPEVVGDAGIIVDATKPDEVVDAVNLLVRDEALRAEYIALGHRRARTLTWDSCVDRLATALRKRLKPKEPVAKSTAMAGRP